MLRSLTALAILLSRVGGPLWPRSLAKTAVAVVVIVVKSDSVTVEISVSVEVTVIGVVTSVVMSKEVKND